MVTLSKPTYVIGIPKWGRSAYGALRLLASQHYILPSTANYMIEALEADRKRIDVESHGIVNGTRSQYSQVREVANFLNALRDEKEQVPDKPGEFKPTEKAKAIGDKLTTDKNANRRGRPDRIKINEFVHQTENYVLIFQGIAHEEAVAAFQKGVIHGAFAGYDEYQALALDGAKNGANPYRRWEIIERKPGPHRVVALGAAGLNDPTWHVFGHPANKTYRISRDGRPQIGVEEIVYSDKFYNPIYEREITQLKGKLRDYREVDVLPTRKSEHMSILYGHPVMAIVNSGTGIGNINNLTAEQLLQQLEEGAQWYERNGLRVPDMPEWIKPGSGGPWLRISGHDAGFSETLLLTDERNMADRTLMGIMEGFGPIPYRSPAREQYIVEKYEGMMEKLRDVWAEPPSVEAFLPGRSRNFLFGVKY